MKNYSQTQSAIAPTQPTANNGIGEPPASFLILAIPAALAISVLLYRQYRIVKQHRQRETLERIWKLDSREKAA